MPFVSNTPPAAGGGGGGALSVGVLQLAAVVAIVQNTWTLVNWSSAIVDTGGYFSAAHPARLTAAKAGTYLVVCSSQWSFVNAYRVVNVLLNTETPTAPAIAQSDQAPGGGSFMGSTVGIIVHLAAGDYVTVGVFTSTGSNYSAASRFACTQLAAD